MSFGKENQQTADAEIFETKEQTPTQGELSIAAVGVRAAFWTVVAIALCFACFLSFFSYTAMRFYTKLDLKEMALVSAEKYLARHSAEYDIESNVAPQADTKYVDALCCAVNYSIDFMEEALRKEGKESQNARYYAKRVDKYATIYINCLGVPDSTFLRTQRIDAYNLAHTVNPALHPYVYSYADYLQSSRFKAWYVLGNDAAIRARINTATTSWMYVDTLGNDAEITWMPNSDAQTEDLLLLLAELSAYIDAELNEIGLSQEIGTAADRMLDPQTLSGRTLMRDRKSVV